MVATDHGLLRPIFTKHLVVNSYIYVLMNMIRTVLYIATLLMLGGFSQFAMAQNSSTSNDTWYVWIDTEVPIDGSMVKIVSNELMVITCCPKSAKYRKFVRKTAKWIVENVSADYNGELSLMKIQDETLALASIKTLMANEGVLVVDYSSSCK